MLPGLIAVEPVGGLQEQGNAVVTVAFAVSPALLQLFFGILETFACRVGYIIIGVATLAPHLVAHHKVMLVPVQYAWQRNVSGKPVDGEPHAHCLHANLFCRLAYVAQRHAVACGMAKFGKFTLRKTLPVMAAYHAKA